MPRKPIKPRKLANSVDLGWAKDTDPIYSSGWNFLMGKNLNPRFVKQPIDTPKPEAQEQSDPARKPKE